jgi:hypothetical protein
MPKDVQELEVCSCRETPDSLCDLEEVLRSCLIDYFLINFLFCPAKFDYAGNKTYSLKFLALKLFP